MSANAAQPDQASGSLHGRVILVTGALGGLGEASARACAAAGATVVLLGRRVPRLNRLYDAIEASGGPQPAIYPLDLEGAGPDDYAQLADALASECGGLHGVLHAAAEFKGLASVENSAPEDLVRALHVNLTAPLLLTRACLPLLRAQPDAAVVFVLDAAARIARAFWGGYGIAQGGLATLVPLLHDETERSSVRVHGLRPGPMRTALRARAFFAENPGEVAPPDVAAAACVELLGPAGGRWRGRVRDLESPE